MTMSKIRSGFILSFFGFWCVVTAALLICRSPFSSPGSSTEATDGAPPVAVQLAAPAEQGSALVAPEASAAFPAPQAMPAQEKLPVEAPPASVAESEKPIAPDAPKSPEPPEPLTGWPWIAADDLDVSVRSVIRPHSVLLQIDNERWAQLSLEAEDDQPVKLTKENHRLFQDLAQTYSDADASKEALIERLILENSARIFSTEAEAGSFAAKSYGGWYCRATVDGKFAIVLHSQIRDDETLKFYDGEKVRLRELICGSSAGGSTLTIHPLVDDAADDSP